jgi:titin
LRITAGNSTVRGLAIFGFPGDGLDLRTTGGNTIVGNHIGTDSNGTADLGNGKRGVFVWGVDNNVIGGAGAGDGNVISGNDEHGVLILAGGTGNRIEGNLIGTDAAGTGALPNAPHGVYVSNSPGNTVGGTTAGAGNVISGNAKYGVWILGAASTGNVVAGNFVGTNGAGTAALANGGLMGVRIEEAAGNTVADNVISGNGKHGLGIFRGAPGGNTVQGNYIGTDATGSSAVPNAIQGIQIFDSPDNQIGGTAAGAGNVIGANGQHGVWLVTSLSDNNVVEGNFIGTDPSGTLDLGNGLYGVVVSNGADNRIGGAAPGAGNTIANNDKPGVAILKTTTGNIISRNSIFDNAGRGIDLGGDGYTPNDTAAGDEDADGGVGVPNNLQNFPVISSAVLSGGNLEVTYSVPSATTNSAYDLTVEFFIADSNGQEGKTFLDDDTYPSADATASRTATISAGAAQVGDKIIATATDVNGNTSEFSFARAVSSPLLAAGGEASQGSRVEGQELEADELMPIVDAAIDRLIGAGFAADMFSIVQVSIADLPGATLGLATDTSIVIDVNAAGYGWYIDPTPLDDSEFGLPHSAFRTPQSMDLLTVVMHELGHTVGLEDLYDVDAEDDLMYAWLEAGQRRSPDETVADRVFAMLG